MLKFSDFSTHLGSFLGGVEAKQCSYIIKTAYCTASSFAFENFETSYSLNPHEIGHKLHEKG